MTGKPTGGALVPGPPPAPTKTQRRQERLLEQEGRKRSLETDEEGAADDPEIGDFPT